MQLSLFLSWFAFCYLAIDAQWTGAPESAPGNNSQWGGWGGNLYNNRWAAENTQINSSTVDGLVMNCQLTYPIGVIATPVVLDNVVYYPTANGSFYALNYASCTYMWSVNVTDIIYKFAPLTPDQVNNTLAMSRTSPQIDGSVLYFGTQTHALLIAVDRYTGAFLGLTQVHSHPLAILTMSPTVYKGQIFIGASSQESSATRFEGFQCCSFVGSMSSYTFDRVSGNFTEVWHLDTLPVDAGWTGAGVWGSQPSIDPIRNQVFFATGNTYTYPTEYVRCLNQSASCLPDDVWQDSIVAVDIESGNVNWRKSVSSLDGWVLACGDAWAPVSNSALCPVRPGPDADFAMAPTFVPAALGDGTTGNDTVVIGQKNGLMYSLNAVTGDIQWTSVTAPNTEINYNIGGLTWGMAVDDNAIYFIAVNYGSSNFTLYPSGQTVNNSAFGSANLKTGEITWEVPVPDNQLSVIPPARVGDLVFASQVGSTQSKIAGAILALNKENGDVVKKWPVDSVQRGGVAVSGGFIMFGSGYQYNNAFESGSFYVYGFPDAIEQALQMPNVTTDPNAVASVSSGPSPSSTNMGSKSINCNSISLLVIVLSLAVCLMI